jgi:DNA polymerase
VYIERVCFKNVGFIIPIEQWECTAIKSAYCGLPLGLEAVSEALKLGDKSKSLAGKKLIQFFSTPQKQKNGGIYKNSPYEYPEKFIEYADYCEQDVVAEKEIDKQLSIYEWPQFERQMYIIDQYINDYGIKVDYTMAKAAYDLDNEFAENCMIKLKKLTGCENPNSPAQLKSWLNNAENNFNVTSLAKDNLQALIKTAAGPVLEVFKLRELTSKTSTKKYTAMLESMCNDGRVRGLFQFYGANKTGRWAGRLVQLQNLPVNRMKDLDSARKITKLNDLQSLEMVYEDIPSVLSQLVRTALIADDGKTFAVSDFSAVEARILSWLASEDWRMEVFATHGKIYEAAASQMFNVPIELVTKDSDYRMRAKNGELALGYQGGLGAMVRMAGPNTTLTEKDMLEIIKLWRKTNPKIVKMWDNINEWALEAMISKTKVDTGYRNISFEFDGKVMRMNLPSGRSISYFDAKLKTNRFGSKAIAYKNIDQTTKKWWDTETYGGKLVENAVQAISRDCLCYSMKNLMKHNFNINMHVHDEIICEVPKEKGLERLEIMENIMKQPIPWAPDLILGAEGYVTEYYKKD